ncbi:AmpG family muropeptide MFS transporter [Nodularia spumigena CS-584]|jgi:MFS transporter, PAT family, beta-lactamase induction signal transducer AmpG|uniref:AmpG family muropeptide MFS transporter n=1 Tax=Nodularia spumigena UHCC 0060 TaxID=3110300 RepID=A0ABU5URH0_NODSP|nr:AmpG family muropeptide MFS transporter [Nodularia spumigena]AHJ26573.1 AmpG permease [Nodularia spumigena CCY9414]EAW46166.1 integral membrane signal transducer protein [Nodularia spumigena CCY9414]MDB9380900.1 AmpG family muropeptide MFS transporter [Nodularia spumigena CS-584]MEA5524596.1 AmpG family muropeptide MFS transporter [Nodularia spumigena UHCC 0143]MEA5555485.1 AmpG family muropeptide MFS transporter [Nodularia spumigena CH309]
MKPVRSLLTVFGSRKMAALTLIGFSSGLPLFLTSRTLQAWMTVEGVDLTAIGLFSLVGLPYSLKFIWSPLIDRFTVPILGRRRGWLITLQIGLLIAIALMAFQQPKQALQLLAINAVAIAFLSASQDIAADAYRTDVLEELELGAGAAVFVLGYRIALLFTGSLALILADNLPWPSVYLFMALGMVIGIIATLFAPEPKETSPPESLAAAVILPFGEFFQRQGVVQAILMLVFIVLYKLGDSFVNNMSTPFLLQTGFTQTDIGAIQGGMGLIATIVGTLSGGVILSKIGLNRSLWLFGALQAVSNLAYYALANVGQNYPALVLTINIENFCGGLGTAAFVAFLMNMCNQRFSATQYALLSSFMAVSRDILVAPAGTIAKSTGWPLFFIISIVAAIPGLLLLPLFAPWNPKPVAISRPGLEEDDEDLWGTK